MVRNLVACSDSCGRVWIEDAEHGRFPPHGFYLSFPQQLTKGGKPHKGNTAKMLAVARKMASADELLEAAKGALPLVEKWCHYQGINAEFHRETTAPLRDAIAKAEEVE